MCLQFDSYCPEKYKVGLVRCLVNRARRICSPSKLSGELDFLRSMFVANGYPDRVLDKYIVASRDETTNSHVSADSVYIRLPYVGRSSIGFEHRLRSAVKCAFPDVKVVTVYATPRAFTMRKDVLPTNLTSHIVYQFECRQCASRYVGKTLQHLSARVRQHVPLNLLPLDGDARMSRPRRGRPPTRLPIDEASGSTTIPPDNPLEERTESQEVSLERTEVTLDRPKRGRPRKTAAIPTADTQPLRRSTRNKPTAATTNAEAETPHRTSADQQEGRTFQSAIATHLSCSSECLSVFNDACFVPLIRGRSSLHLDVLESVFIKTTQPTLCTQKTYIAQLYLYSSTLSTK